MKSDFRNDINGLRAISVALVVFFHLGVRGSGGGFIGVDVFFVISGYLMTKIIMDKLLVGKFSYWNFVCARALRIWPALGMLVAGLLLIGSVALPPVDLLQVAKQSFWVLSFWSNHFFLDHSGYATQAADGNWFLHTWSLAVEWQFYLLYPGMLLLASRLARHDDSLRSKRIRSIAIVCCLLAALCASFSFYLEESRVHPVSAFFLLTARAWEPLAGALVFFLDSRVLDGNSLRRALLSYAGCGLILTSALWFGFRHLDPVGLGWYSAAPVLGAMLVLWSGWSRSLFLNNAVMQAVGKWSYSIYLWHWPLIVICAMDAVLERHPLYGCILVLAGSTLLGWISYRFVESRPRAGTLLGFHSSIAKPLLAFGFASIAAVVVAITGGLQFRMPYPGQPATQGSVERDYFPTVCGNYQKKGAEVRLCQIDKQTSRTVLVIGDSYAEHLYPWFETHSLVSVDFLTEAGCPPVPNFDKMQAGFYCLDFTRLAWSAALQPRYDTVVISGNWGLVGGAGPPYCHVGGMRECRLIFGIERQTLVLSELRRAIHGLLDAGKTVVVLDVAPVADINIPRRIERELFWFGTPRFEISAASVIADNAWIDPLFAEFEGVSGYHRVSLRSTLCDASRCKVYDSELKRSIYEDERHFDPLWMAAHGGVFAPFVQTIRMP